MQQKKKLKIQDIIILTPKQQIKKAILEKYNSLDEFAESIGLYPDSLKQYLRRRNLGSSSFKIKLTQSLGKGYDEIVKSEKQQIAEYTNRVLKNITMYHKEEDIQLIKKLKCMCFESEMFEEYVNILKEIGIIYFYKNQIDKAEENIKLAIKYLKLKDNKEYLFSMSQLLYVYIEVKDFVKAKIILTELESILNCQKDIKCERMHAVYYHMGEAYWRMGKNDLFRKSIIKSIEHARDNKERGISTILLAVSYVLEKKYDVGLDYYEKSLEFFSEDDTYYLNIIYANIAYMYKRKKEYYKACFYIDKVFKNPKTEILTKMNNFLKNFAEIKIELEEKNEVLIKLKEILNNQKFDSVFAHLFINDIYSIINMVKDDSEFLESLKKLLIDVIKENKIGNKEITEKLKKIVGEITLLQF